jgi:hypothetical protein
LDVVCLLLFHFADLLGALFDSVFDLAETLWQREQWGQCRVDTEYPRGIYLPSHPPCEQEERRVRAKAFDVRHHAKN